MLAVPTEPLDLTQVLERWPTVRQSLAASYDDCPLSTFLQMKYARGWSTTPQARGTLFHRTAAEILRTLQEQGSVTIPRREALEILVEVCRQEWTRDELGQRVPLPAEEIVRVPMRQMPELRMAVDKFAKDNQFSIEKIVAVEKQLSADLTYPRAGGGTVTRTLTGTLDALLSEPDNGAVVLDWKDTWALPPNPQTAGGQWDDDELKGLSFHGYFQQRWYGWLVMRNFRHVQKVTLREFYPRKTRVRRATLFRHQMPDVEEDLALLIGDFDRALQQGPPNLRAGDDGMVDIDALEWWKPQPGKHCGFCVRPTSCPIEEDVRVAAGGAVTTPAQASLWAARFVTATRIRDMAREALKGYQETSGVPTPVRWAKGRMVIGWHEIKRGRRFGLYVPDDSDRGAFPDVDAQLAQAMRDSTQRARAERGPRRRRVKA